VRHNNNTRPRSLQLVALLLVAAPAVAGASETLDDQHVLASVREMYMKGTLASGAQHIAEPESIVALAGTRALQVYRGLQDDGLMVQLRNGPLVVIGVADDPSQGDRVWAFDETGRNLIGEGKSAPKFVLHNTSVESRKDREILDRVRTLYVEESLESSARHLERASVASDTQAFKSVIDHADAQIFKLGLGQLVVVVPNKDSSAGERVLVFDAAGRRLIGEGVGHPSPEITLEAAHVLADR
jgi:hypothetical protein